jgi:transcriptional regulator with XRE-family HTH domain
MIYANINLNSMTDSVLIKRIGLFVKETRILQNKTQAQLAIETGLNRYTIGKIENGGSVTLQVLIQILRALDALYVLENFTVIDIISPLEAVKLKKKKKKRVRASSSDTSTKRKSDW